MLAEQRQELERASCEVDAAILAVTAPEREQRQALEDRHNVLQVR